MGKTHSSLSLRFFHLVVMRKGCRLLASHPGLPSCQLWDLRQVASLLCTSVLWVCRVNLNKAVIWTEYIKMELDRFIHMKQMASVLKPDCNYFKYLWKLEALHRSLCFIKGGGVLWPMCLGSHAGVGWVIGFLGTTTAWKLEGHFLCTPTTQGTWQPPKKGMNLGKMGWLYCYIAMKSSIWLKDLRPISAFNIIPYQLTYVFFLFKRKTYNL